MSDEYYFSIWAQLRPDECRYENKTYSLFIDGTWVPATQEAAQRVTGPSDWPACLREYVEALAE